LVCIAALTKQGPPRLSLDKWLTCPEGATAVLLNIHK